MNRVNLDFLIPMFPFCPYSNFSILIINQTSKDKVLVSECPSVKVINSFDIGISKSRNLAISNSEGKILLFADDDVVFIENFDSEIIQAHKNNPLVPAICFQTLTTEGNLYSKYPEKNRFLTRKEISKVLSIELTCKSNLIKKEKIIFNELFGLGSQFQDSETFFFLMNMKHKNYNILFYPKNIVIHKSISSSDEADSDRIIYAKMAGFYKRFGFFAYLFLLKYMFFLFRKYNFSFLELNAKFFVGLKSIQDYKLLLDLKKESLYE